MSSDGCWFEFTGKASGMTRNAAPRSGRDPGRRCRKRLGAQSRSCYGTGCSERRSRSALHLPENRLASSTRGAVSQLWRSAPWPLDPDWLDAFSICSHSSIAACATATASWSLATLLRSIAARKATIASEKLAPSDPKEARHAHAPPKNAWVALHSSGYCSGSSNLKASRNRASASLM